MGVLPDKLREYIQRVHDEPYRVLTNNCLLKNIKVARKARRMGLGSTLVFSWAQTPLKIRWFYPWNPHILLIIDGVEVDPFYANYWNTDRVIKGRVKLFTIRGKGLLARKRG